MSCAAAPPLCIDLDGSLLRTDLLHESAVHALRHRPWLMLVLPRWLKQGKAILKQELAQHSDIQPSWLPWREEVIDWLRSERAQGRQLILVTASDQRLAQRVAEYLNLFDEVIASNGHQNLRGATKREHLVQRFGERGFDYLGNDATDLEVWRAARSAVVIDDGQLAQRAAALCPVERIFDAQPPRLRDYLRALRLHQWLKNLLLFIPLFISHQLDDAFVLLEVFIAFVAFGLCASSVYLLNDLCDLDADRRHPRKRFRPMASGNVPLLHAVLLIPLLLLASALLCLVLPTAFTLLLLGYYVLTLLYSLQLKSIPSIDVIVLALLYTTRILGGVAVLGVVPSFWLLAFSMFIFLSLALVKRCTELDGLRQRNEHCAHGRGYDVEDLPVLYSLGTGSGYLAVLVLALYINSPDVRQLYATPEILWLICPAVLYWITRIWLYTHRGAMHDDPVVFAVTDRISLLTLLWCTLAMTLGNLA